jgi:hypothetical protein
MLTINTEILLQNKANLAMDKDTGREMNPDLKKRQMILEDAAGQATFTQL